MSDRDELKQAAGEQAVGVGRVRHGRSGSAPAARPSSRSVASARGSQSGELQNVLGVPTSTASADARARGGHHAHDPRRASRHRPHDRRRRRGRPRLQRHQGRRRRAAPREDRGAGQPARGDHRRRRQALADTLGSQHALPVEIVQFAWRPEEEYLTDMGAEVDVRRGADNNVFVTDEGNWILDCTFPPIEDPARLSAQLSRRAGVVEHGLFLGLTTDLIVASAEGVEHRTGRERAARHLVGASRRDRVERSRAPHRPHRHPAHRRGSAARPRRCTGALDRQRFALVLTSPLQRARETARLAGFADAVVDDDLVEWDYGDYEGLTSDQIHETRSGLDDLHRRRCRAGRPPSRSAPGRSGCSTACRRSDGPVLLFAHGHFLRVLTATALELGPASRRPVRARSGDDQRDRHRARDAGAAALERATSPRSDPNLRSSDANAVSGSATTVALPRGQVDA